MPYKIVKINDLDDGAFHFVAHYWANTAAMSRGEVPDWKNDFTTDLDRVAGNSVIRLRMSHDNVARTSSIQRADTLEWISAEEWLREGGLYARGVMPAYETLEPGLATIRETINNTIASFQRRRQAATLRSEPWSTTMDLVGRTVRAMPDKSNRLHSDLFGLLGSTEESI